jgi:hypothetical protein
VIGWLTAGGAELMAVFTGAEPFGKSLAQFTQKSL